MIGNKAQTSTDSFIKLVYERRYIELMKGVDDTLTSAWHIISSLFHKKSQARTLKGEPLDDNEYTQGIGTIEKLIDKSFDYKTGTRESKTALNIFLNDTTMKISHRMRGYKS